MPTPEPVSAARAMESGRRSSVPGASTATSTTVLELAEVIWRKVNGDRPLRVVHDEAFEHDVQRRIPSTDKAREVLGFEATTTLDEMLDEVIPWIRDAIAAGTI